MTCRGSGGAARTAAAVLVVATVARLAHAEDVGAPSTGAPAPTGAPAGVAPAPAPSPYLPPSPAIAQGAAPDVLTLRLRDGGILRGELVEWAPGRSVTIKLATAEVRTVPWQDVVGAAGDAAAAPGGAAPAAPSGPSAVVTLVADDPDAELQRYTPNGSSGQGAWVGVGPTGGALTVPAGASLRVAGHGVRPSSPFSLPPGRTRATVSADVAPTSRLGWGIVLTAVGGGAILLVGLPLLGAAALTDADTRWVDGTRIDRVHSDGLYVAGGVVTALGVAGVVTGVVLLTSNRTRVEVARTGGVSVGRGVRLTPTGLAF